MHADETIIKHVTGSSCNDRTTQVASRWELRGHVQNTVTRTALSRQLLAFCAYFAVESLKIKQVRDIVTSLKFAVVKYSKDKIK